MTGAERERLTTSAACLTAGQTQHVSLYKHRAPDSFHDLITLPQAWRRFVQEVYDYDHCIIFCGSVNQYFHNVLPHIMVYLVAVVE